MLISLQNTQGTGGLHTLNGHRVNTDYQITVKGVRGKRAAGRFDSQINDFHQTPLHSAVDPTNILIAHSKKYF